MTTQEELTSSTMANLVQFINQRGYDPGEKLPSERQLAERFGVGRGVIREVLSVLERLRYLERRRNSGAYLTVTPERISLEALGVFSELNLEIPKQQLKEAIEVRRIIEVQAVMLAAKRRSDEDLKRLQDIVEQFDYAIDTNITQTADLDYEFHMAIFRATKNLVLNQVVSPFYIMSETRRRNFFTDRERCQASNKQHKEILSAIKDQDPVRAKQVMAKHIGTVEAHYEIS